MIPTETAALALKGIRMVYPNYPSTVGPRQLTAEQRLEFGYLYVAVVGGNEGRARTIGACKTCGLYSYLRHLNDRYLRWCTENGLKAGVDPAQYVVAKAPEAPMPEPSVPQSLSAEDDHQDALEYIAKASAGRLIVLPPASLNGEQYEHQVGGDDPRDLMKKGQKVSALVYGDDTPAYQVAAWRHWLRRDGYEIRQTETGHYQTMKKPSEDE